MSQLRVGVIGAGHLGRIHARLLQGLSCCQLVSVVDPSDTARKQIEESLSVPTQADYRSLTGRVDAVVIASPTTLHYSMAHWALSHGLHCLVEKPLVKTAADAQSLNDPACKNGCVLQVGHVERFNPAWVAVRSQLFEPMYIESVRAGAYTGRSTDIGVVLDLMIHDLDLILQVARCRVDSVEAMGLAILGQCEDIAEARIRFTNGCVASLKASRVSRSASRRMQVYGSRGFADIDFGAGKVEWTTPSIEVATRRFQADLLPQEERAKVKDELFTKWLPTEALPVVATNAIEQELLDFSKSIRNGMEPQVTGRHAQSTLELAEQILACIASHSWGNAQDSTTLRGPMATPRSQGSNALPFQTAAAKHEQIQAPTRRAA